MDKHNNLRLIVLAIILIASVGCKEKGQYTLPCTPQVTCLCDTYSYLDSVEGLCKKISDCTAIEFEVSAPTSNLDRVCSPLSVCNEFEFEIVAPSYFRDRECAEVTVCTDEQYESRSPSSTSDRECSNLTVCGSDEVELQAPTETSDRICAPCECVYGTCMPGGGCECEQGWEGNLCDQPDTVNPPVSMRLVVNKQGQERTFVLFQYSVRPSSQVAVRIVDEGGAVSSYTPSDAIRTYRGYCEEEADAWVGATLLPSGALRYQVIKGNPYDDWEFVPEEEYGEVISEVNYTVTGDEAKERSGVPMAGANYSFSNSEELFFFNNVYRSDVAVIITKDYLDRFNYDTDTVIRKIEDSVARTNGNYIRDLLLEIQVSEIIIRKDVMTDWDQGRADVEAIFGPSYTNVPNNVMSVVNESGSGLAYVCFVGGETASSSVNRYAVSKNGIADDGSFYGVFRHEYGHNLGSGHFEGGSPEGPTIMSGNSLSRFSKYEVDKIMECRNTSNGNYSRFKESLGFYEDFPIPPYAQLDDGYVLHSLTATAPIDILANDYDANGDAIALSFIPEESELGGELSMGAATGSDERDQIMYTPPSEILSPVLVGACEPGHELSAADCSICEPYFSTTCSDSSNCNSNEFCFGGKCRASSGCTAGSFVNPCGQPCPNDSLKVWLDTADRENLLDEMGNRGAGLTDGTEITAVLDRSGNQNDAKCYHADRRPTLYLEGENSLTNRGALHFEDDFLEIREFDLTASENNIITSIAVLKHSDGTGGRLAWVQQKNGFDSRRHQALNTSDGVTSVSSVILDSGSETASYWYNISPQESPSESIFENGGAGIGIGAQLYAHHEYTGAYFGNFVLGELLIYNRALSENELKLVQSYLLKKWNVPILDKFRYRIVDTTGLESGGEVHLQLGGL